MGEYPKYPNKYHWRKRFLIPKPYLHKMRSVEGFTVQEIADWHHKELGVKVSKRVVEYYLSKFKIYKPKNLPQKKKRKKLKFNHKYAVWYLTQCLNFKRYPFRYLDRIQEVKRKKVVNKFFMVTSGKPLSRLQRKILWSVFKRYEVSSRSADLFFPKRNVMIDWGKVDDLRRSKGISIYGLCKGINLDRTQYYRSLEKGFIRARRERVIKINRKFQFKESDFSKEYKL